LRKAGARSRSTIPEELAVVRPPSRPSVTRLPGLGMRLDIADERGMPLTLVRRTDGTVELHPDAAPPIVLGPATARAAAAFAAGHYAAAPALLERVGDVMGGLVLEWRRIGPGSTADGRTIEDLQVRRRTGATIVAVLRGPQPVVDPDPGTRLVAGDELVVLASDAALDRLDRLVGHET
jgi:TrkA domain protein